jgi:hypothetical protein
VDDGVEIEVFTVLDDVEFFGAAVIADLCL